MAYGTNSNNIPLGINEGDTNKSYVKGITKDDYRYDANVGSTDLYTSAMSAYEPELDQYTEDAYQYFMKNPKDSPWEGYEKDYYMHELGDNRYQWDQYGRYGPGGAKDIFQHSQDAENDAYVRRMREGERGKFGSDRRVWLNEEGIPMTNWGMTLFGQDIGGKDRELPGGMKRYNKLTSKMENRAGGLLDLVEESY